MFIVALHVLPILVRHITSYPETSTIKLHSYLESPQAIVGVYELFSKDSNRY